MQQAGTITKSREGVIHAARQGAIAVMARAGDSLDGSKVYITIIAVMFGVIVSMLGVYLGEVRRDAQNAHNAQQVLIERWANVASENAAELRSTRTTQTLQYAEMIRRLERIENGLRDGQ